MVPVVGLIGSCRWVDWFMFVVSSCIQTLHPLTPCTCLTGHIWAYLCLGTQPHHLSITIQARDSSLWHEAFGDQQCELPDVELEQLYVYGGLPMVEWLAAAHAAAGMEGVSLEGIDVDR